MGTPRNHQNPGTLYRCSCWKGGNPHDHPHYCPTHREPWVRRWFPPKGDPWPEIKDWDVTKQGEQK